jgi:hypothetical protein
LVAALSRQEKTIVIEILQPIQLQSNRAEFEYTCTPSTMEAPAAAQKHYKAENITIATTTTTDEEENTTVD